MTDLEGQTVVVIGGSAGIGLEAARVARVQYAEAILTRRNPDRLRDAADEFGARGTATFDPNDLPRLERYFAELPKPVDHVLVAVPPVPSPRPSPPRCARLPIGLVIGPADVAELAVHLMTKTALTGATYDIDGGQQLLSNRGGSR